MRTVIKTLWMEFIPAIPDRGNLGVDVRLCAEGVCCEAYITKPTTPSFLYILSDLTFAYQCENRVSFPGIFETCLFSVIQVTCAITTNVHNPTLEILFISNDAVVQSSRWLNGCCYITSHGRTPHLLICPALLYAISLTSLVEAAQGTEITSTKDAAALDKKRFTQRVQGVSIHLYCARPYGTLRSLLNTQQIVLVLYDDVCFFRLHYIAPH